MVLLVGCNDNATSNSAVTRDLSTIAAVAASSGSPGSSGSSGSSEGRVASSSKSSSIAQPDQEARLTNFCSDSTINCIVYWDRILSEYPDLVDKLKKIRDERDQKDRRALGASEQTEVRFYSEDGSSQTVSGSQVDIIVTDLQRGELNSLISFLVDVPEKARQLGFSSSGRFDKTSTKEKGVRPTVIVLGGQGSISIKGSKGIQTQHIDLFLADKQQTVERIVVNTFGKRGESALNRLPKGFVKSGLGARPPPNAARVVVIGALREVNIEGSKGQSTQVISFQKWADKANDITITDGVNIIIAKAINEEVNRLEKEMEAQTIPANKTPEYKQPETRWPWTPPTGSPDESAYGNDPERRPPQKGRRHDEPAYGRDPERRPPPLWRSHTLESYHRPPVVHPAPSYHPSPFRLKMRW